MSESASYPQTTEPVDAATARALADTALARAAEAFSLANAVAAILNVSPLPVDLGSALPAGENIIGGVLIGSASTAGDGAITTGGMAQSLFGGIAPTNGWKVSNPHPTEDLWVADNNVTAAPNVGFRVFANGGQYATEPGEKPSGALSIYGATTGHSFSARHW